MQLDSLAHFSLRRAATIFGAGALLLHAGMSSAGCASAMLDAAALGAGGATAQPLAWRHEDAGAARLIPVASEQWPIRADHGIVGLWKFEMVSKSTPTHANPMPDGTLVDFGTASWHGDGTEFQASGFRNPSDGDVCQGVWKQVDESTFVLNHYALAWQSGVYAGPVHIRAEVSVNRAGTRYSGNFVTIVYAATPTIGHEFDETTPLVTITGTFTATRVTIDN